MKKVISAFAVAALMVSALPAQAGFKEFTLQGHSATTYNENGYTLGLEMVKKDGLKQVFASVVLPKGVTYSGGEYTYQLDSNAPVLLSLDGSVPVGASETTVSWLLASMPDHAMKIPNEGNLHDVMSGYKLTFSFVDSKGIHHDESIGLRNSAKVLKEMVKR